MSDDVKGEAAPAAEASEKKPAHDLVKMTSDSLNRLVTAGGGDAFNAMTKFIYESKWFNTKSMGSAAMVLSTMLVEKLSPVMFRAKYWMLDDGPSMRADYMLAEFHRHYGTSTMIACTPDRSEVVLKKNGARSGHNFVVTWAEILHEKFIWTADAKKGTVKKLLEDGTANPAALKDNWATPRGRQDMMWARCISAAIRKVAPEVNGGMYTPEELDEDFIEGEVVEKKQQPVSSAPPAAQEESSPPAAKPPASAPPVVSDAKPHEANGEELVRNGKALEPATEAAPTLSASTAMSDDERKAILIPKVKALRKELLTDEQWKQVLDKNYNGGKNLTVEDLAKLCTGLEAVKRKKEKAKDLDEFANRAEPSPT